eukprot:TRINITY_DN8924_c0_g1_i1.p1 TRINITY_DN8924_c0_g1~~TRINITY_DN8924_c0_g1_i1.p1  ORF type:complete len:433 (+),score=45.59 TRINITY_DN8924_c0_g1_i1:151-1449(+)
MCIRDRVSTQSTGVQLAYMATARIAEARDLADDLWDMWTVPANPTGFGELVRPARSRRQDLSPRGLSLEDLDSSQDDLDAGDLDLIPSEADQDQFVRSALDELEGPWLPDLMPCSPRSRGIELPSPRKHRQPPTIPGGRYPVDRNLPKPMLRRRRTLPEQPLLPVAELEQMCSPRPRRRTTTDVELVEQKTGHWTSCLREWRVQEPVRRTREPPWFERMHQRVKVRGPLEKFAPRRPKAKRTQQLTAYTVQCETSQRPLMDERRAGHSTHATTESVPAPLISPSKVVSRARNSVVSSMRDMTARVHVAAQGHAPVPPDQQATAQDQAPVSQDQAPRCPSNCPRSPSETVYMAKQSVIDAMKSLACQVKAASQGCANPKTSCDKPKLGPRKENVDPRSFRKFDIGQPAVELAGRGRKRGKTLWVDTAICTMIA